jgi:hypothetical protein
VIRATIGISAPFSALELVRAADVAGAKVDVWVYKFQAPGFLDIPRYFVRLLDRLGLDAKLHVVRDLAAWLDSVYRPDQNGIEMFMIAWYTDYPEPGGFIPPQFACGAPANNGGFCDPAFDDATAEAGSLLSPTRPRRTPHGPSSTVGSSRRRSGCRSGTRSRRTRSQQG